MRYTPPSGVATPVNLNGVEVTAWIYCPTGSRGDPNNPNGIQIFVKDETWKSEYSTWVNIFENVWFKVTLIPSTTAPQNGSMDAGFDPTKIISVGVKIGAGTGSTATYNGPIYTDVFAFPQPGVPLSDYIYNFNDTGALSGIPRWNVDPGWGAQAWSSVYLSNNALTADATFNIATDPQRKGYVNIFYAPPIYLTNKDSHTIRAEIKFDPQPGPFDFAGTLWVYDKQNERWYQNDYKSIGGGIGWNVLTFNLNDNTAYDPDLPLGQTMPLGQIVRVGIQLYANVNYTGKVYFDNITIGGKEITANYPQNNVGIVGRSTTYFMLSGQQFYFAGANAEYLFEKSVPIEQTVLDSAKNMNLSVVRTWAFGEGEDASFQPQRGKFNQSAFGHLDRLIAYAGKKGIRLVLPLVDNWGHYGGMYQYMDWALAEHPESVPNYDDKGNFIDKVNKNDAYHDQFYVNPWCKQWYKDYVTSLLNRTNSITGVRYKDDPNIFSWEVFNEPRCKSDVSGKRIHDWIVEMSAFVKSIDSGHLVGSGEEGSYITTKAQADVITWQTYPDNYWEYGCNWTVPNGQGGYTNWGSNGADFLSDHKSTDTTVYWQAYIGAQGEAPVQSEVRAGVPNIDYCSFRTYIDQREFNLHRLTPNDQSLKWIEQHKNDASNVIGKPVIMEEFGIHTVGYIYWGGFGETKFHRYPAYTESDRRNIYAKYYDYIYNNNIGGSFFWNLGYDGMREDLFDGCENLQHNAYSTWAIDPNSDATAIALSTVNVTQGTKSFKCDYTYNPTRGKAWYDLPNLSEKWEITVQNPPSSGAINRAKFMFDVYNAGNVQYVAVAVLTGPSWTWHESTMQAVNSGWNTIVVDLASETWKSAASGWNYTGEIDMLDDVRKITLGLFGYSGTGSVYIDNVRILEDDGFVIYPQDRVTSIISTHAQMMSAKPAEQRWMKHLPVPWYKEENSNYSGAATLQMMLDHIGDWFSQTTLYNYGRARNSPPNASSLQIDPQGMRETLMNYKPTPYYFSILSRSLVNDSLRDICYWIDYDVPGANPPNTSAAVPTYAAYDNWMVVRGASASADPSSGSTTYTVYGFWLNDPAVSGLGEDSYKTASEFTATYFKPIISSDSWNGLYVTVAEPPPVASTAMVTIAPAKVNEETAELLQKLQNNKSLAEINWEAIIDSSLLFDQGFLTAFKDTFPRQATKVKNLTVNGKDYYLIPFNRIIDTTTLKEATYVVMIIDAVDGHFKEAAWSEKPEKPMDFLPVSKDAAIQKVRQASGLTTATASALLVWKPDNKSSSPYKPVWQVTINSQIWYVNQDGMLFAPPAPTYYIKGYVKNSAGKGISGVKVTLSGAASKTYTTGTNGYYQFTGLLSGNCRVTPTKTGLTFTPVYRDYKPLNANKVNQNFTGK
ncbi:MAG: carboxypeptidase regulatory-like domain-containing protein [Candidatus Omnitrophota bacterium]|nr:carboxypeptidase regulatory-like domain-containing protein [Candidatus Omnitrophota bacterium]